MERGCQQNDRPLVNGYKAALPSAGVSIRMERGCQQNDRTPADGCQVLEEMVSGKWDVDGLELDFMRHPGRYHIVHAGIIDCHTMIWPQSPLVSSSRPKEMT